MKLPRRNAIIGVVVLVVVLGITALLSQGKLRAWAFSVTGEEALLGQVRGVGQYALNLTRPPLNLAPDVPVNHGGLNPYGINTFLHNEVEEAKRERQVALIAEAGFHWLREEFPWEDIEIHGRGDFVDTRNFPEGIDAWGKYDQIVGLAEQYGLEMIVRLSNPPSWSRGELDEVAGAFAPPDDYDDYARFVSVVAERYRGRIRYYQLWNEPNIYPEWGEQAVNPEAYTDLLCRAYRAIKAADPDSVVISGALAPNSELGGRNLNDYVFLQRMYQAGAGACFDVLAMQGYGLWSGPADRRMDPVVVNYARNLFIRDIMVSNGDAHKAIWLSEMNWNAIPEDVPDPRFGRVTLDQQARYAPMAYQRAMQEWPWMGVVNFWYFKRADPEWLDQQRPEAYFQMSDPDFNLMPVYESMQAQMAQEPVMYAGAHWADHWAVAQAGWEPWRGDHDRALRASVHADPLRFSFSGTGLDILPGEEDDELSLVVDGETQPGLTWRGKNGLHRAEIIPQGEAVVVSYVVRERKPTAPLAAGIVVVMLVLGWQLIRRFQR